MKNSMEGGTARAINVPQVTRRNLLQGGLVGAALAAAGSLPAQGDAAEAEAPALQGDYELINCDLLIVGSGYGGTAAAFKAMELGMSVVMVDKGPFISSGATGMNFHVAGSWYQNPMGFNRSEWPVSLANDEIYAASAGNEIITHMDSWYLNHGEVLCHRNEDGTIKFNAQIPDWCGFTGAVNPLLVKNDLRRYKNFLVHERTMLTDLIVQDGKCLGAMGIYLPTGGFRVYRAKATIVHTGGCGWMYGWNTVAPYSPLVPDNTADLDMAAWRHGAGISEAEFTDYDLMSVVPSSVCCGYAGGIGADTGNCDYMMNSLGERFYNDQGYFHDDLMANRALASRLLAIEVAEGRGGPNGGIYVDYSNEEAVANSHECFTRNIKMYKEVFGIDVTQEPFEVVPELQEHGGHPVVNAKLMSVDIEGLFHGRGAGVGAEATPTGTNRNATYGNHAAQCAVEYIETSGGVNLELDMAVVAAEYNRLHSIRLASSEDGLRPVQVRRAIQKVGGECLGVYRDPAVLAAGVAELERIRLEDMPRQFVTDHSTAYNSDWKEAIENYNLLAITQMSVEASLLREETRGGYFRPDFPNKDDENWKCMLVCYQGENGELVWEKQGVNDIDWSTYDVASLF